MLQKAASVSSVGASLPRVIFSGIQPTGIPHLGNYAGALRQWAQLQKSEPDSTRLIYSIVDLHAITTPQKPESLRRWKREGLAALLAIGIDPDRCTLFYQSSVPAHSELMWILSCTASMGYLSRMTQWKSKLNLDQSTQLDDKGITAQLRLGLFSYPVLQAADVLVHRATHVPVGHDQHQHLEFARECVTNFNASYGSHLVYPQTLSPPVHRVMSLTEPESKMSKSHKSEKSRILLTDTPETIRTRIGKAITDSIEGISYDRVTRPGISNLLDIMSVFDAEGRSPQLLAESFSDLTPKQLKQMVADVIIEGLSGVRGRYLDLLSQPERIDMIEAEGRRKARQSADETMTIVRDVVGL